MQAKKKKKGRGFKQGIYTPVNESKWKNDKIVYRSSYEYLFNRWCDLNPNVIAVASERVIIPYFWDIDQKMHKYYMDYIIKVKTKDNTISTFLVEIKPESESQFWTKGVMPKRGRKSDKTWETMILTMSKNKAKWTAATEFAKKKGIGFKIITEEHLFR